MSEIRAFLAIRVPAEVQASLANLQEKLRSHLPALNWVRPEHIHVTLKFFGSIPSARVDQIHEVIRDGGIQIAPFRLNVESIGVFPHLRSPKVLWAGLTGEVNKLLGLHDQVLVLLEPLGFPIEEKPFYPHVTLARIKSNWSKVGTALKDTGFLDAQEIVSDWVVDRVVLYKSELTPSGAHYTSLWSVPLIGSSE